MDHASHETYDICKLKQFGATTGTNPFLKSDLRINLLNKKT